MANISWWRSWHGAPMDHKWTLIAVRANVKTGIVSAIAWALMDYASQHKQRGSIDGFDVEVYAIYSGFSEDEITAVIQAMRDKGIISDGRLTNWEKRQPQREDDSTLRVREWRMKHNVTQSNAEAEKVTSSLNLNLNLNSDSLNSSSLTENPQIYQESDVFNLIAEASGMVAIPPKELERIEQIYRLLESYGWDDCLSALKANYQRWTSTPRKNGSGNYAGINFGWVDWAQDWLAGNKPREKDPSQMTDEEYKAWKLQGSKT